MHNEIYKNKYLKYKNKYLKLKKNYEQEGGLIFITNLYIIFYSSADSKCDVAQYKHGDAFFSFNKMTSLLGENTYAIKNNDNVLIYPAFVKNISIKDTMSYIIYDKTILKNEVDSTYQNKNISSTLKTIIDKSSHILNSNIHIDTNYRPKIMRLGIVTFLSNKKKHEIENIIMKYKSEYMQAINELNTKSKNKSFFILVKLESLLLGKSNLRIDF
jgi:hypothetical protein